MKKLVKVITFSLVLGLGGAAYGQLPGVNSGAVQSGASGSAKSSTLQSLNGTEDVIPSSVIDRIIKAAALKYNQSYADLMIAYQNGVLDIAHLTGNAYLIYYGGNVTIILLESE